MEIRIGESGHIGTLFSLKSQWVVQIKCSISYFKHKYVGYRQSEFYILSLSKKPFHGRKNNTNKNIFTLPTCFHTNKNILIALNKHYLQ